ncbi:MAG TPA: FAD-dependent monooxygenase, partial [Pyrinomonadaceae bacterium]|nr:FAD-dependent monooxygenase [Pyrinomonadaceae bacterium]
GSASKEVFSFNDAPKDLNAEAEFDVVYAGGTLGLLHAAVMACAHNRKVLVFDAHTVGKTHRDWNISDEELRELTAAGLFTPEEIEKAVANRYRTGFVKFYEANSRIKTPPLFMENVLDVALEADKLLDLAVRKLKKTGSEIINNLRFVHAYAQKEKVLVECRDEKTGKRRLFSARLFVDATGTNSPVSRQLNAGKSITHVCPTVGTLAKGFQKGSEPDAVDFSVGEILVSTEDISDDRQLMWEGFAGNPRKNEYTTYLFFYDSVDSRADKSLFRLFEEYFEKLPRYKTKTKGWKIVKPVFGYIPSIHHHGWRSVKKTASERILLIGDAAGLSSPLTFCGFGSHVRNLRKLTGLTEEALQADALDGKSLSEINAYEPRVAQMASLAEFMRPAKKSPPTAVNETMNAVMMALSQLDGNVRREMFQDRISFANFRKLLRKTATIHPKVFRLMFDHLGASGAFWWIANIAEAALHERKSSNNGKN